MKKVITILAATVLIFSCNKQKNKEPENPVNKNEYIIYYFSMTHHYQIPYDSLLSIQFIDSENLKSKYVYLKNGNNEIKITDTIKRYYPTNPNMPYEMKRYCFLSMQYFDTTMLYTFNFNKKIDSIITSKLYNSTVKKYYFTW